MNRVARVVKIVVMALILVFISTGCMRAEFVIELNEDGTGNLSSVIAMTEEAYNLFWRTVPTRSKVILRRKS